MSVRESVTNLNSGKVDDSKLSRLVPGANPESFCALIDRYYIREHCIVDLIANSATNFENYRILSASSKVLHGNQHLLLLMTGKDSTKLVDYSRSKAGVEIIETNFMLSSDAIPISLAYSNNGVLVSAWDSRLNSYQLWSIGQGGKESKLLLQEKGHILGGDDEGYREPSIVSFENGKFFLWCTPSKLIFGESPL
jgi:hypothetical protein